MFTRSSGDDLAVKNWAVSSSSNRSRDNLRVGSSAARDSPPFVSVITVLQGKREAIARK
jgi:hypothetical protein